MHILGILSIRFTSQKKVNKGREALTEFIENRLECQDKLANSFFSPFASN